ncbi:MAG TPA: transglutaminase domain-containing protein, partial [Candidatus Merdenecus merdavium]|nr:transglutaminase domain-containing protein [Candidatus Merdenecus merdavium]
VSFQVYNYCSLLTIAEVMTDDHGKASFETGLGSLYILVSKKGHYGTEFIHVKHDHNNLYVMKIKKDLKMDCDWKAFDMIAPKDAPINTWAPTKEQKESSKIRIDAANHKRVKKVSRWENEELRKFLSQDDKESTHSQSVHELVDSDLRKKLLKTLTNKDLTDCKAEILEDHFTHVMDIKKDDEFFTSYVLNPRVWDEILSPYRSVILRILTKEEKEEFQQDPKEIWNWIQRHIKTEDQKEHPGLFTTPVAILKTRVGSQKSKKVLFVAIARTLGIPARLHPYDHAMEYVQEGRFVTVFENEAKTSTLELRNKEGILWRYLQNWSMARWNGGNYETLNLSSVEWNGSRISLALPEGRYRILTGNRLPNGNVFAYQKEIVLENGKTEFLDLELRQTNLEDMLLQISIHDFTLKDQRGKDVSISELTKTDKRMILWLEESMEPTEHILNELLELDSEFTEYKDHIIFIVHSKKALEDPTLKRVLKKFPTIEVYYDDTMDTSASHIETVGRRVYVDHEKLPLILVTNKERHVIYATSGYNVGTGEMLLRIMHT